MTVSPWRLAGCQAGETDRAGQANALGKPCALRVSDAARRRKILAGQTGAGALRFMQRRG